MTDLLLPTLLRHHRGCPLCTIYHPPVLFPAQRSDIVQAITKAHCESNGSSHLPCKSDFYPRDLTFYFCGGNPESSPLRIVSKICAGRSKVDIYKNYLLVAIYKGVMIYEYEVDIHLEDMSADIFYFLVIRK